MTTSFAYNHNLLDVLQAGGFNVINGPNPFGPTGMTMNISDSRGRRGSIILTQADRDGAEWLHASIAFGSTPTYDDLVLLHRAVFGRRRYAFQVFAPDDKHISIHDHALHLWGRADGANMLPDFGEYGTI